MLPVASLIGGRNSTTIAGGSWAYAGAIKGRVPLWGICLPRPQKRHRPGTAARLPGLKRDLYAVPFKDVGLRWTSMPVERFRAWCDSM